MGRRKKNTNKPIDQFKLASWLKKSSPKNLLIGRERVMFVCKVYNLSDKTLLDFLESKGYKGLNSYSLLNESALNLIDYNFQNDKNIRDKIRGQTNIQFNNPKHLTNVIDQNELKSFIFREPILHLQKNIFQDVKKEVSFKGYPNIMSNFNDAEVENICSKMSSSFTRKLCNQLTNPKANRQQTLYQLHFIANKAYEIFGGKILTFIHSLRNLNFKNQTAIEAKTYTNVIPAFPLISFVTGNTAFKISFFVTHTKMHGKSNADMRLFTSDTIEEVGKIDEEGYIISKLEKFKPQLTLFCQSFSDYNLKIYSGVETGNREFCGKILSHPVSLRIGIGPICAKNKQIDEKFYNFG